MSGDDDKKPGSQAAPASTPDGPETPSGASETPDNPVDGAEAALKEGKSRVADAYRVAMEKSFGKTWGEKLQFWKWPKNAPLFVKNFFTELFKVQEEREETTDEAESEVAEQVVKGTETFDIAENLAEEMDKEAGFEPEEKEAVATLTEDVLEAAKATGEPEKAIKLVTRVQEDAKDKKEDPKAITESQMRLAFSTGLFTMVRLRERFDSEREMADFLTRVKAASGKSARVKELSHYLGNNFRKLFNFKAEQVPSLLGLDPMKFASLAIPSWLGGGDSDEKMDQGLDILLPELFPTSVRDKGLPRMRKFFKRLIAGKKYPEPATIAELTFMLDEDDMRDLAKKMGGAKVVSLASVRATEKRKAELRKQRGEKALAKKGGGKGKEGEAGKSGAEAKTARTPDHKEKEQQQAA